MGTSDNPLDGALEIGAGRSPTVVRPAEGQRLHTDGVVYSVKASGSVTARAHSLIEVYIEPGGIMPPHRHAAFEEGIYVLDGIVQATLDGDTYEATAGSFLIVPWACRTRLLFLARSRTITAPHAGHPPMSDGRTTWTQISHGSAPSAPALGSSNNTEQTQPEN
jgi:mannose-6-phosphate isomerase-like protein (cupin superfamily)